MTLTKFKNKNSPLINMNTLLNVLISSHPPSSFPHVPKGWEAKCKHLPLSVLKWAASFQKQELFGPREGKNKKKKIWKETCKIKEKNLVIRASDRS